MLVVIAGAGARVGVGVGGVPSSSDSRTVRNDAIDPLSLPSSSSWLRSLRLGVWADAGSTLTRGGAEGITIGFGGGTGGGEGFRSALRNGTFGGVPAGATGIDRRGGGGGSEDGRGCCCFADDDGADAGCGGGGGVASTLPGARTDSNEIPWPPSPRTLYFVTDGGARTLNRPPTLLPPAGSGGNPAPARSHAVRLSRVTPSTIAMSDNWLDPARPASACG